MPSEAQKLKQLVQSLPDKPGVYQYLNKEGKIIYVGKAKNLKKRVSSYFNKEQASAKVRVLVSKIADLRYVVVNSEEDALLLENNLIKEHQPRYNVLLKDDKTYPSICVTKELFPRVFKTRDLTRKHCRYFGPYAHLPSMYAFLDLVKKLYPIRSCRLNLTPENIAAGRFKVCLDYHIHRCAGPCVGLQSGEEYNENVQQIIEILKGNTREVSRGIRQKMLEAAEEMRFEDAQSLKEKYLLIENFCAHSEVVNHSIHNVDVFSIEEGEEQSVYINFLHVRGGAINRAHTFEYKRRLNESLAELLAMGIMEMRERYQSTAREIVVPFKPDLSMESVAFTVPQRGEKKKLLDLSQMNVRQYRLDKLKQTEKLNPEQKSIRILKELQETLGLEKLPMHIECFDNSHIMGSDAVSACVVFKKGKPEKKDYRHYIIRTVEGPDDYASLREVANRRYTRMREEEKPLPELIIVDGGKGQMSAMRTVIKDELHLDIPIVGLVKDAGHKTSELLYGQPPRTVGLKPDSSLFRFLTSIQEEVHRFAISFHRNRRSKQQTASVLDTAPGIGPKTKQLLLQTYKSVKQIKQATPEELAKLIGEKRAKSLLQHLTKDL